MSSFLSVFLCLAILFGTQGFTVGKMLCLSSGKINFSFSEPVDCCPKKSESTDQLKNKCCDLKSASYKLSSFQQVSLSKIQLFPAEILSSELFTFSTDLGTGNDFFHPVAKAPPLTGRQILAFNSTFLI